MTDTKHTDTSRSGDLVERLRSRVSNRELLLVDPPRPAPDHLCREAADRIEALEAENERLRGALRLLLEDYLGIYPNDTAYTTISLVDPETEPAVIEARAALGEKQ